MRVETVEGYTLKNCSVTDNISRATVSQVYLVRYRRHTKSIRSEMGIIKIAICCPFKDIMLSIKHLIADVTVRSPLSCDNGGLADTGVWY